MAAPPVVAVLVTRNPGDWLERALAGLDAQDYPDLTILVLDAGSQIDPTPRVAEALPTAYVRRLDGNPGFAGAANEARGMVEGATFYFLCHDDVIADPDAVRLMVEEAYRSNAAIVGPKLVDDDDPDVLLEVGMTIDRFGSPHSEIVPGELDHEQHDGVRDVFYVSSAAMLVRADLFAELGGFDPDAFPGSEDLDLCWRARVAGARVMVMPDARVRHRRAAPERELEDVATADELERTRLRSTLVAYAGLTLVWMVPWMIVHTLVETVVFVVTGRFGRAAAVWKAWWWNLRRFGELRSARKHAQASRRVPDRELRALQVAGSMRARRYLATRLKGDVAISAIGDTGRAVADRAQASARQPLVVALVAAAVVFAFGSRGLWFEGIPQVGQFADWPSVGDLWRAFGGGWRETLLGSPTTPPPLFAFTAGLGTVLFGATGLAETLLVLVCVPVGVVGVLRAVRSASGEWVSASAAGLAYALMPVWRNAIANGRLGPLVFFALAPFVVRALLTAAGATTDGTAADSRLRARWFRLAVLGAFVTMFYPPALLLGVAVALALGLCALLPGQAGSLTLARRSLAATGVAVVGAFVVLFPWPLAVLLGGADAGSVGLGTGGGLSVDDILRMSSGPAASWWGGIGLLVAGLLVLAIGQGPRLVWGIRAWALALVGFLAAWLPARFAPGLAVPADEAPLTVFALGVAVAVGFGFASFVEDLRGRHFGWRQGVSLAAFLAIALSSLGFLGDSVTGRWHAPRRDWPRFMAFAGDDHDARYRVLWVGEPSVLPFDPAVEGSGLGWVLTTDGAGDVRDSLRAPVSDADAMVASAIDRVGNGETVHLGRLLAPMGVRYVIVPERIGPRAGMRDAPPATLVERLDAQIDLSKIVLTDDDASVYENTTWIPMTSVLGIPEAELADADPERVDLAESLLAPVDAVPAQVEPVDGEPVDGEPVDGEPADGEVAAGAPEAGATAGDGTGDGATLLWSQAWNTGWQLELDGSDAGGDADEVVGVNGWSVPGNVTDLDGVRVAWGEQWMRNLMVFVQAAILAVVLIHWRGWWGRFRPRRRGGDGAPSDESADVESVAVVATVAPEVGASDEPAPEVTARDEPVPGEPVPGETATGETAPDEGSTS